MTTERMHVSKLLTGKSSVSNGPAEGAPSRERETTKRPSKRWTCLLKKQGQPTDWKSKGFTKIPIFQTVWRFLKKLKREPPSDPAIPRLGVCVKRTKQEFEKIPAPQCSQQHSLQDLEATQVSTDKEWIKKMYIQWNTPQIGKKKKTMLSDAAPWTHLEGTMLRERGHREQDRYAMTSLIHRI